MLGFRCGKCGVSVESCTELRFVVGEDVPLCIVCRKGRLERGSTHDVRQWFYTRWYEEFQADLLIHDMDRYSL